MADGDVTIQLDDQAPQEGDGDAFTYDENEPNLVEQFLAHPEGKKYLKEISDTVIKNVDNGFDSTEEYRKRFSDDWRILAGELKPKTWPWADCANVHVPLTLENVMRLAFRTESELFQDWNMIFNVVSLSPEDDQEADYLTKHGNWQLRSQIPDFKRQMARMTLLFYQAGDVTTHSFYDFTTQKNRHEVLTPDEFVTPYQHVSTMPDWSDAPWRARIVRWYRQELQKMRSTWSDVDKVLERKPPSFSDEPANTLATTVAETHGIDADQSTEGESGKKGEVGQKNNAPYTLYWYEGWITMPDPTGQAADEDRDDRFMKVVVDKTTGAVLELSVHEMVDWQDQQRYDRQAQELENYRQLRTAHDQAMAQQGEQIAMMQDHMAEVGNDLAPLQAEAAQNAIGQAMDQFTQTQQQAPTPPTWMQNPDDPAETPQAPRKVPIHLFAHGVCVEPLAGNLGFGYGRIQTDLNRAVNTAMNQFTDAATLGNVWCFVVTDAVEFPQPMTMAPGKPIKVNGIAPAQLKDAIIPLKPDPANPQLKEVAEMLYQWAQSGIQAPNVLSGEPGKSGETFRGINLRAEQALKQTSVSARKLSDLLEQILKNNALLNSMFLPEDELVSIVDPYHHNTENIPIRREMYQRNYHVEIRSDLRFTSQAQKVQESDDLFQLFKAMPPLMADQPLVFQLVKNALEARGRHDLVRFLGPPPDPPTTTFGIPLPPPPGAGPSGPPGAPPMPGQAGPPPPQGAPAPKAAA